MNTILCLSSRRQYWHSRSQSTTYSGPWLTYKRSYVKDPISERSMWDKEESSLREKHNDNMWLLEAKTFQQDVPTVEWVLGVEQEVDSARSARIAFISPYG